MALKLSTEAEAFFGSRRTRLVRFNGAWFTHESSGAYRETADELVRADVRRACDWALTSANVSNTVDEIKAATVVDHHAANPPLWLEPRPDMPAAASVIACQNGILDRVTERLYPHDNALFTLNALPYAYDPHAPLPQRWIRFLEEVFAGDVESIGELQKLFGYLLTPDTSLQKIFAIIGPTRSGKGTIGRVIEALIGRSNVCGPSFHKIGGDFGLQSFIGKQLALIADARLGHRTDRVIVAERVLSISGEDSLDIARKGIADWHGKLNTRLLILSNELPALPDPSGALAARFIAFSTPNSFLGREDRNLTTTLLGELPGILNWALAGYRRLAIEGRIVTPTTARDLIDGIESLGSPVKAFVADCCVIAPDATTAKDDLWAAYGLWHRTNGVPGAPLSKEMFARAIKTAFSGSVKDYRPRVNSGDQRPRFWSGIAMRGAGASSFPVPSGPSAVHRWSG